MPEWHLITSEYPPDIGGVADYSRVVARGLSDAGEIVHVWCREAGRSSSAHGSESMESVFVHREFNDFSPAELRSVGRQLDRFAAPRRLLIQWVPHGYGYRSMNVPLCFWLWQRAARKHDRIEVMVHEPFLAFGEGSRKQDCAAAIHRLMVFMLLKAATKVWISIPAWKDRLAPFVLGGGKSFEWLPVPSSIPVVDDPVGVAALRGEYVSHDASLVGHFGAYDQYMVGLMSELLPLLLASRDDVSVILLGKGSMELRELLVSQRPDLSGRLHATGSLDAEALSRHVSACDVMLQPYQDGVSGRRTSAMTALSHGVPIVTTSGKATEMVWNESGAACLVEVGDLRALMNITSQLLNSVKLRTAKSKQSKSLYFERFDARHTISALRSSPLEP